MQSKMNKIGIVCFYLELMKNLKNKMLLICFDCARFVIWYRRNFVREKKKKLGLGIILRKNLNTIYGH